MRGRKGQKLKQVKPPMSSVKESSDETEPSSVKESPLQRELNAEAAEANPEVKAPGRGRKKQEK